MLNVIERVQNMSKEAFRDIVSLNKKMTILNVPHIAVEYDEDDIEFSTTLPVRKMVTRIFNHMEKNNIDVANYEELSKRLL